MHYQILTRYLLRMDVSREARGKFSGRSDRRYASLRILAAAWLTVSCAGCGATLEGGATPSPTSEETRVALAPANPARREMRDLTTAEKATLVDGFASGLDNPLDAKFRWAKISKPSSDAVSSFQYCGIVNVKNSNGRYDGWQPFLATITTTGGTITGGAIAALNAGNKLRNRDVLPKLCSQKGLDPVMAN